MIDITELKTKYWQHKAGSYGEVVCDLEDIGQCYETIVGLTKGDVPLQPNLGADVIKAIGENPNDADKIIRAILLTELPIQEPRGKIVNISTEKTDTDGHFKVFISYKSVLDESGKVVTREVVI